MAELWTSLSGEVQAALIVLGLYIADVIATKTPNPIDNILVRWAKEKWGK